MPNPIFNASNVSLTVTNLYGALSFSTLDGIPLTTSNGAATGRLAVPVVLVAGGGGATAPTITSSTETVDGTVAAGAATVTFTFSSDFDGTVNGVSRTGLASITFEHPAGISLPAIAYTVVTGSIVIDKMT